MGILFVKTAKNQLLIVCQLEDIQGLQTTIIGMGKQGKQVAASSASLVTGSVEARRAGTLFPPTRFKKNLRKLTRKRIAKVAGVAMAGSMDQLVAEILDMACNISLSRGRKRVSARDIMLATTMDRDSRPLVKKTYFAYSGTHEHVHEVLMLPYKTRFLARPGSRSTSIARRISTCV